MTNEIIRLIEEELIFLEDAKDNVEVFEKVGTELLRKGLVKYNFVEELIKREKAYPTGMNMKFAHNDDSVPNIAIPHTEVEYCNTQKLVVVNLKNEVKFRNMINPEESLEVKFLFIILNNCKTIQTNMLSDIMSFLSVKQNLVKLSYADNPKKIYNVLIRS